MHMAWHCKFCTTLPAYSRSRSEYIEQNPLRHLREEAETCLHRVDQMSGSKFCKNPWYSQDFRCKLQLWFWSQMTLMLPLTVCYIYQMYIKLFTQLDFIVGAYSSTTNYCALDKNLWCSTARLIFSLFGGGRQVFGLWNDETPLLNLLGKYDVFMFSYLERSFQFFCTFTTISTKFRKSYSLT